MRERLDAAGIGYSYLDAALATRKAELFVGLMDEGNVFGSSLDADDIRELLA